MEGFKISWSRSLPLDKIWKYNPFEWLLFPPEFMLLSQVYSKDAMSHFRMRCGDPFGHSGYWTKPTVNKKAKKPKHLTWMSQSSENPSTYFRSSLNNLSSNKNAYYVLSKRHRSNWDLKKIDGRWGPLTIHQATLPPTSRRACLSSPEGITVLAYMGQLDCRWHLFASHWGGECSARPKISINRI